MNMKKNTKSYKAGIRLSKVNGQTNLFHANQYSNHYIQLEIVAARETEYNVIEDYKNKDRKYISIKMSALQFSELITNFNAGLTPCTLYHLIEHDVEKPIAEKPFKEKAYDLLQNNLDKQKEYVKENINKLLDLVHTSLSKKRYKEIVSLCNSIQNTSLNNLAYTATLIEELIEKVAAEVSIETKQKIETHIRDLGLNELKNKQNLLK